MRRDHHSPLARISLGLGIEGSAVALQCPAAMPGSPPAGPPPTAPTRPGRAAWAACGPTRAPTGRSWAGSCGTWRGDTRTGCSPTSHRHPQGRQRARGRAAGGAGVPAWCTWTGTRSCWPTRTSCGTPQGTTAYLRGAVVGQDSPACQRVAVTAGFFRPGPSAVSLRRPARLPKTCATSSEAGEVSALSSSLRNSGREVERQAPHTEAQALARCARCRGSNRARCGRRRRNPSGPCSGSTSGSTGPGRPRPARRPGRDSRCRTGSRPGPGTRPSRGSRRGPARRRRGPRRRRHPRRGRRWRP